ncbi:MAG: ABC transporter permease [Clostridia bacterium]|jgi:lipopolysaccharide transport system permease protein
MLKVFKELYKYRELLKTNVKKEIRGKYKNSFLGVLWSFLNPLLQIVVYAIVFQLILKNPQENYAVFICCGLIPWTFFSSAITRSAFTMVENGNIVKKVYFPREILPISIVTSEAVNFLISTIIILAFVIFGGIGISKYIIFYPLVLVAQYVLLIAIGLIVSSISVYVRDLQHLIGVALQLFFYATPIVYSADVIPAEYRWILNINPMTYIIEAYRDIFYNQTMIDIVPLLLLIVGSLVACMIGYMIFNKLQKGFAEQL